MQQVRIENDFESWRDAARDLLSAHVEPDNAMFVEGGLEHALLPGLAEPHCRGTGDSPVLIASSARAGRPCHNEHSCFRRNPSSASLAGSAAGRVLSRSSSANSVAS
jgi:hypothetical protein